VTYAFYYDVPGDETMYQQVKDRLGPEVADGLNVHLVTKIDGGLRHLNVWRTAEDWQRYQRERVAPAVRAVLSAAGVPTPGGAPIEHELHLGDLEIGHAGQTDWVAGVDRPPADDQNAVRMAGT
jgi:hypothetical protein